MKILCLLFLISPIFTVAAEAQSVVAQSGGMFKITRSTLDAGGSTEKAEDIFVLRGTIGQSDAGTIGRGTIYMTGGFWSTQGRSVPIFLDGFETGDTSVWSDAQGLALSATDSLVFSSIAGEEQSEYLPVKESTERMNNLRPPSNMNPVSSSTETRPGRLEGELP